MSSTVRISYEQPTGRETLAGSANWAFDIGTHALFDTRVGPASRSLAQFARLAAVLLAVSSMSTGPDPWCDRRQQRSQLTMSTTFQASTRRRISVREALQMADDIMQRAEKGRMKAAEEEAKYGFDWESMTRDLRVSRA